MKQTQIAYLYHPAAQIQAQQPHQPNSRNASPASQTIHLRDGDVVLYKRENSRQWQARFKLFDRKWHRISTRNTNLQYAARVACDAYDEARFREKYFIPQTTRRFEVVANEVLQELRNDLSVGRGKAIYVDYCQVIEKYLIPYFGKRVLTAIDHKAVTEFEKWRNEKMGRAPKASTLLNHSSAFNRVFEVAVDRGWLSDKHPVPRLTTKGEKSAPRPAFNRAEIDHLLDYMVTWTQSGKRGKDRDMRELLRDYVEILLLTGMRHGTESMNIKWRHLEWYVDAATQQRYLRIWVSGKTGPRWLIPKHAVITPLQRIQQRWPPFAEIAFDDLLARQCEEWLFRLPSGLRPPSLNGTFQRLMEASGMLKDASGKLNRTLYSLRHTYATFALIEGGMDIHTLAKQMGTSVGMIEKHYSKLTPTLNAAKLA